MIRYDEIIKHGTLLFAQCGHLLLNYKLQISNKLHFSTFAVPACICCLSVRIIVGCFHSASSRTSTKCWQLPACLEAMEGESSPSDPTGVASNSSLDTPCLRVCRSSRSSPATDSPNTPSPLPDPAFQLAIEAQELVTRVGTLSTEDKGMQSTHSSTAPLTTGEN